MSDAHRKLPILTVVVIALSFGLMGFPSAANASFDKRTKDWVIDVGGLKFGLVETIDRNFTDGHIVHVETAVVLGRHELVVPMKTWHLLLIVIGAVTAFGLFFRRGVNRSRPGS